MTDHVARLYATALAVVVFFLCWAAVAARPWGHAAEPKADPRISQLDRRAEALRQRQVRVQGKLDRRFAAYRVALARRQAEIAALQATAVPVAAAAPSAPSVSAPSVATVPAAPVTQTRSS
jgi:hypothetical protein